MNRLLYKAAFAVLFLFTFNPLSAQIQNIEWIESGKVIEEGIALHDEEKYDEAIKKYKLVNRNDTLYISALYEMALSYKEKEEFDKAIEACKEGIMLRSENLPLFYNIYASALDMAGRQEEAIKIFDEGLKHFPLNINLLINKGITLRRMKKDADAADVFQRAVQIDPYSASAHYHLGMIAAANKLNIPAILSLQTFLLLEHQTQRALNALIVLESVSQANYKVNEDSVVAMHGETGDFSSLETLIASKIALTKEYDLQVKTSYDFIRPVQLVFEKLKYRPADKGFWMHYYVPLYVKLWEKKQFKPFVYYILGTINNEEVQKNYKKYQPDIKEMLALAGTHLKDINKKGPALSNYSYTGFMHWYGDGYLQAAGNIGSDGETRTGTWYIFYPSGVLRAQGNYQNGKKTGIWDYYRSDGTLSSKEENMNDNLNGISHVYYPSGVKSMTMNYKEGVPDGELTSYYATGQKKSVMLYKDGKKNGSAKDFHDNGQTELEISYKDGIVEGPCKFYHATGGLQYEYSISNNLRNGSYKEFYPSGALKITGNYSNGNRSGEFKTYYEDGKLKENQVYDDDLIEGKNIVFYADGKTFDTEREYKKGKLQSIKYYDEDGIIYGDLTYKDNKLIKHVSFDKKGAVLHEAQNNKGDLQVVFYYPEGGKRSEGNVAKGELDGLWKFYMHNGQLDVEENYADGILSGMRKEYYANGKLFETINYTDGDRDGKYNSYYKNGIQRAEGFYKNGQKEGEWAYYHENGKISAREYFIHNTKTGYQMYYNGDGTLYTEENFKEDFLNGYKKYDDGKITYMSSLENGSGQVKENLKNGKLRKSVAYKNGNMEGLYEAYYPDGKTQIKMNYKAGLREGAYTSYFADGKISNEGNYLRGDKTGMWKWYFRNGKPELECAYKNDLAEGERVWYYPEGGKETTSTYKDGEINGYQHYFAADGTLRVSFKYKNGRLAAYTYLGKDGKPLPDIAVKNESIKFTAYFPNGQKSAEGEFRYNYREGTFTFYNTNGKPGSVKTYNANEQEGISREYFADGTLRSEENHVYGNLHGEAKYYNQKGKLIRTVNYIMGEKHGDEKIYNAEGKLAETHQYAYDIMQN